MSKIPSQNPVSNQYILKKIKDRKVKQVLPRGGYQWEGGE
jgi:hypothetical protein